MIFILPLLLSFLQLLSHTSAGNSNEKQNTTLLLVQAVLRHGERAPLFLYKNDPNEPEFWREGLGKLTRLGKRHHYGIGKFLRSRYKDFLTTDPKEVWANSSSLHRCLTGASVTVAALYQPEGIWKFEDDLNWQPIPIYYLPEDEDKYLNNLSPCPLAFEEVGRLLHSEEMWDFSRKHQEMLKNVSSYIGMDISKEFNSLVLFDTLLVEKAYNLTIPILLENYFEELRNFAEETFKITFGSKLLLRVRYGPLLGEISRNMKRKVSGEIPDLKFQLSCVQDVQVAALLKVFNFSNMPRPPYCSMLLFELHEMDDTSMAVRLLYMNTTAPSTHVGEPHVLILEDCSEFCPLENFTKWFQHLIPDDWELECHLYTEASDNKPLEILLLVVASASAFSLIAMLAIYCYSVTSLKKIDR